MYVQTFFLVKNVAGSFYEKVREKLNMQSLNTFAMTILENNYYWQVFSSLWGLQALVTLVPFYSQLISQQIEDPVSAGNNKATRSGKTASFRQQIWSTRWTGTSDIKWPKMQDLLLTWGGGGRS